MQIVHITIQVMMIKRLQIDVGIPNM